MAEMKPRLLVTGASGFVGRHCLRALAADWSITATARHRPDSAADVDWDEADLFDSQAVTALMERVRPQALLHLAWYAIPGKYWTAPENHQWVEASQTLLRAFAASGGQRMVGVGSCAEYDWSAGICHETETSTAASTLYGQCKNAARQQLEAIAVETGVSFAWGRLFHLFGPEEPIARFVPELSNALLAGRPVPCSDGTQQRDFIDVRDVASALTALLAGTITGPVNIGSGEVITVGEVAGELAAAAGHPELLQIGAKPRLPHEPQVLIPDTKRLREELGWRPGADVRTRLRQTVAWWRENG